MIDLVGVPYTPKGMSPEEGFDCFTLIAYFLNTELGLDIPKNVPAKGTWGRWLKIYEPPNLPKEIRKYDVLMFAEVLPGIINHLAVMVSDTDLWHTGPKFGGVVCEPLYLFRNKIAAIGRPIL